MEGLQTVAGAPSRAISCAYVSLFHSLKTGAISSVPGTTVQSWKFHVTAQRSAAQPQRLHWRRRFLHCGNEGKALGLDVTADLPYAAQVAVRQSSRPFVGGASAQATSAQATVLTMQALLSYVMLGNLVVVSLLCR